MRKSLFVLGACQTFLLGACMLPGGNPALGQDKAPVELGKVRWTRDLAAAYKLSKTSKKPIFAFFQEVPG
ncbi:MAG: hypothetical protein P1V97_07835 [Planctomycetota bacterium]|nr:hypothetical protein [Planctomycetota bacterium]